MPIDLTDAEKKEAEAVMDFMGDFDDDFDEEMLKVMVKKI